MTLWVSMHTADPLDGTQVTGEVSYPGYMRMPFPEWTVKSDGDISTTEAIYFPSNPGPDRFKVRYFAVGARLEGPGLVLTSGEMTPALDIRENVVACMTVLNIARGIWTLITKLMALESVTVDAAPLVVVQRYVRRYGQTEDMELSPPASV